MCEVCKWGEGVIERCREGAMEGHHPVLLVGVWSGIDGEVAVCMCVPSCVTGVAYKWCIHCLLHWCDAQETRYNEKLEECYRQSMLKSFIKTLADGFFPVIVLEAVNNKVGTTQHVCACTVR